MRYYLDGMLMVSDAPGIVGGMSGSPIIAEDGTAIGIVCLGHEVASGTPSEYGPHPRLTGNLPGWFLKMLVVEQATRYPQ